MSEEDKSSQYRYSNILDDEPIEDANLFKFDYNADELTNILMSDIPTPFAILLNGEWGSGKTSLIKTTFKRLENTKPKNWKTIYFNPWQYEGFDPRTALFVRIVEKYESNFKNISKSIFEHIPHLNLGINLGILSVSGDPKQIIDQYTENIDKIENLHSYFAEIVKDKLIIFIDDLDRCTIDNTLDILEATKLFLSIKGAVFVVAADIEKLERAWELRYGSSVTSALESKNHIDKIFQLKLSLPEKNYHDLIEYFETLTRGYSEKINETFRDLILTGCIPNPRSIKRVLNLYSIVLQIKREELESKFGILVLSLTILSIQYPELLKMIKSVPITLFQLAHIAINFDDHVSFKKIEKVLGEIDFIKLRTNQYPTQIHCDSTQMVYSIKDISPVTIDALKYLIHKPYAYKFLRKIGAEMQFRDAELKLIGSNRNLELEYLTSLLQGSILF